MLTKQKSSYILVHLIEYSQHYGLNSFLMVESGEQSLCGTYLVLQFNIHRIVETFTLSTKLQVIWCVYFAFGYIYKLSSKL